MKSVRNSESDGNWQGKWSTAPLSPVPSPAIPHQLKPFGPRLGSRVSHTPKCIARLLAS